MKQTLNILKKKKIQNKVHAQLILGHVLNLILFNK